ncbi:hypothetical protein [Streptomyces aureus]|uniref:hypothetical protein n=1 Tax=Streptomyces aureus TaxID=193461 RepID=UPI00369B9EA2
MPEVYRLADAVPPHCRALVLLAAFAALRFGELAALQRRDIDLEARTVAVRRSYSETRTVGRTSSTGAITSSPTTWTVRSGRCGALVAAHLAREWHSGPTNRNRPETTKAQITGCTPADLGLVRVLRLVGADGFEPPTSAL